MNLFKNAQKSLQEEKVILFGIEEELQKARECGDENRCRILKRERGFSSLLIDLMEVELKENEIIARNNSQLDDLAAEIYG